MDVSVIIPTKNRLWSLPKAVESCRSSEIEVQIIVVDDASDDGTADWLRRQPDLLVVNGEGWGKPWGVNRAMSFAKGKYVRYLDSDDWLNAGANEKQFAIGRNENADVVVAGYDTYKDDVLVQSQQWIPTDDFIAQQLGESFASHYSSFLLRRDFIKDIPHRTLFPASDFASRDDRCFMLEVALRHPTIAVDDAPTLCHRHHGRSRLQFQAGLRRDGIVIQQWYIYQRVLGILDRGNELTQRRKDAAAVALWPLAHWMAYTHLNTACEVAELVRTLNPKFRSPETGLLNMLYQQLGFRRTERILQLRRSTLWIFGRSKVVQTDPGI
jgi:glycosyltransferase involved in cell wall biosynthesis